MYIYVKKHRQCKMKQTFVLFLCSTISLRLLSLIVPPKSAFISEACLQIPQPCIIEKKMSVIFKFGKKASREYYASSQKCQENFYALI